MELRQLTGDELKAADYIWSQAFERGDRAMEEMQEWIAVFSDHCVTYGLHDVAGLQATFLVMDFRVHLGPDVIVPMGALGGVACLPATRGRGYAGTGLRYTLERMREAGQVISMLDPFSWDYYRRFGWEWVAPKRRYSVATSALKPDPETERVRAATLDDRAGIRAAYTEFAGRYRGMLARDDRHWAFILDDSKKNFTYTYVYEQEGRIEGYLTYRGGKEEETRLEEFISLTPRAQRALLGLLRRHEMQVKKFVWNAPPDDGLWSQFYHWELETTLRATTMARVVDVAGALQAWKPSTSAHGHFTLGVQDENAPWNTGTWQVEFEGGHISVEPTQQAPQVSLDIQALSQAYFGTPTVDELRRNDRLQVQEEAGYTALRDLLAGPPAWLNDGF